MGDISRHRDIYLNTRDAIPPDLLAACKLSVADLTYLELGNYFTDVSQFRDPVFYIFAKRNIWRENVLPKVAEKGTDALRAVVALLGFGAAAAIAAKYKSLYSAIPAAVGTIPAFITDDMIADWNGVDEWIDRMFGVPFDKVGERKRTSEEYGYVGQFFEHFVEGITHLLFAADVKNKVKGSWSKVGRIPQSSVIKLFKELFTQYYPHEHTDQPPYVWDASKRPRVDKWYCPSDRQRSLKFQGGVMNVVDRDYNQYLAQRLTQLEKEFLDIQPSAAAAEKRRLWLARVGKVLHAVEDWYFHSNVVELIHLRGHKPPQGEKESDEEFLARFVLNGLKDEPEYKAGDQQTQAMYKRRLFRRLRYPEYEPGDRQNSGGVLSKVKPSSTSLHHAYPAFPSQEDSTHTLLHALGGLEEKIKGSPNSASSSGAIDFAEMFEWLSCAWDIYIQTPAGRKLAADKAQARGVTDVDFFAALAARKLTGRFPSGPVAATIVDVMREWLPLVVTLFSERERKRLVGNVDPLQWPISGPTPDPLPGEKPKTKEADAQLDRHKRALAPKVTQPGKKENNYEQAARLIYECGFINDAGRAALVQAFKIDKESQDSHPDAPGAGGVLIQFAVKLQRKLNEGNAATNRLNKKGAFFLNRSDDGSFHEIVGSHSLMSKDTTDAYPYFDDARMLASVASQTVFHILLQEVIAPTPGSGLDWTKVLHNLVRYPTNSNSYSWERHAIALFRESKKSNPAGQIPKFADLPKLALLRNARLPAAAIEKLRARNKAADLEKEYSKLEAEVAEYRYP